MGRIKTIDNYEDSLEIIIRNGYNPIAVTTMVCEETFCFETEEEATRAHQQFEGNPTNKDERIQGWWYGRESFMKEIKDYEIDIGYAPEVIWLIKPPKY